MKNVDTIFALEFVQLLENHLFASPNRDEELEIICSSLNLKSRNQLAQVYAGYDVPTTASIFELIRTLNNAEFIERFFKLKSVNLGVTSNESPNKQPLETLEQPLPSENYFKSESDDSRQKMSEDSDYTFEDFDFSSILEVD